jgi:hypothetical protein
MPPTATIRVPHSSESKTAPPEQKEKRRPAKNRHLKILIIFGIVLFILAVAVAAYIRIAPFSRGSVLQDLHAASGMSVTIRDFHRTHFPSPGAVMEGVEFHQGPNNFTILKIDKLVIKGTYLGLLLQHVNHVKAVGAHVYIPPFGSDFHFDTEHSKIVVDQIIANGTVVEVVSDDPKKKPLIFDVHDAFLTNVRWGSPIHYELKFHNPEPPGEVSVQGNFGPWATGHPGDTPFSGDYSFDRANLGVYGGIAGFLSSTGHFSGALQHLNVAGSTDTPDFEVTSGGHTVNLKSRFDAYVDAIHGDTYLKRVEAKFGHSTVIAEGKIAGVPGQKGKFANLKLVSHRGRIEDMLGLFVTDRSPMSGEASLTSHVEIPPGPAPFLERINLDGSFGVDDGAFTNLDTQKNVDELSAGARGQSKEDPETVVSNLKGNVVLTSAVSRFSNLSFEVPGADARMQGTFGIVNHRINLHGKMQVDTRISKTSSGVKALLLRLMDPIFKKKKKGEIVPVHITGTYEKPQFGLDLTGSPKEPAAPK